jgi:anthranilate/para-aminobenzoate synthase component I
MIDTERTMIFGKNLWEKTEQTLVVEGENSFILENSKKKFFRKGNPFSIISEFVREFEGEKVGYISYNLSRFVEKIEIGEDDLKIPDAAISVVKEKKEYDFHITPQKILEIRKKTEDEKEKEKFISRVQKIKDEIFKGNAYQVNISRRIEFESKNYIKSQEALSIFLRYYKTQPVPYSAFFDFSNLGFIIASGSMELFLEKNQKRIRECPIKGTRKLGNKILEKERNLGNKSTKYDNEITHSGNEEEEKIIQELKNNEKERAENLMIVDMVRNDLGKICLPGTVKVNRLFDVEKYSTLIHLVSEVEGELKTENLDEILLATFPPASVTGAPKKSAMEIIEKLEEKRRGPYCGAICYFKENGDFTMSVAIRIFLVLKNKIFYWTGCGITYDSDPKHEWEESITKTKAFTIALFPEE